MRSEQVQSDITVVGGGLAGVCAAVAAARLGRTVALVQNRPVLGGNSSSEVRVWVCGATAHGTQRYARETGIMGEMFVENQYTNPEGNPYYWDLVVLETVRRERNIRLFLNTDVHEVEADGPEDDRRIRSVTGWMSGSERRIRFESEMYLDCTGDGLVGFLAGAKYRLGREAKAEYGEAWAPDVADDITLGSTLLFYTKDAGRPVKYVPPAFAKDIASTSIPLRRVIRSGDNGCAYWWIEWGGELDTVHDNERIRDELWSVIYGIWDYIKNSGQFDAANMTLEWVGSVPGKREYRRFVGDYVLNQNDILAQRPFEDRVAFGGWSIDLHPPQGVYAQESGSKHMYADGIYHIPFRSLYSANVSNMMMAGRNISATHVAFGTTRVMATCAVLGEAAGTGAALCVARGATPRQLAEAHLAELQQTLLRQDASIVGVANEDAEDLARAASVRASSELRRLGVEAETAGERMRLETDIAVLFPVDPALDGFSLLLDAAEATTVAVELWDTGRAENYVPHTLVASAESAVAPGEKQWTDFALAWTPSSPRNAFVVVKANPAVAVYRSEQALTGTLHFVHASSPAEDAQLERKELQPVVAWRMDRQARRPFCFRAGGETEAYAAAKAVNGYRRPYGGPNLWASEPLARGDSGPVSGEEAAEANDGAATANGNVGSAGEGAATEAWLELSWEAPVALREVHLVFNDEVNDDLINLHHHRTPYEIVPELAKDYRLEAYANGAWTTAHRETGNRVRRRVHAFDAPVAAEKLRLVVESTNGGARAELVEIRAYA